MSNDWRFAGRFLLKKVFFVFFPAMKTGRLFRCLLLEKGREGIKIRKGKYLFCAASYFFTPVSFSFPPPPPPPPETERNK